MASGRSQPQSRSRIARISQQIRPPRFMDDEEPPRSTTSVIRLDDPFSDTRRRAAVPRQIPPFRTGRTSTTVTTQEKNLTLSFVWEIVKRASFLIPYLVGVIVILYYIFQWLWLLFRWILRLWPQIANSPVLPSLSNISSNLQGLAVVASFFLFISRVFKKEK